MEEQKSKDLRPECNKALEGADELVQATKSRVEKIVEQLPENSSLSVFIAVGINDDERQLSAVHFAGSGTSENIETLLFSVGNRHREIREIIVNAGHKLLDSAISEQLKTAGIDTLLSEDANDADTGDSE